jgi:hypothetical protein
MIIQDGSPVQPVFTNPLANGGQAMGDALKPILEPFDTNIAPGRKSAMSATAKTLCSLGLALVGLLAYLSIFVGYAVFKINFFGFAIYLGLALTVVLFLVVLAFTSAKAVEEFHD